MSLVGVSWHQFAVNSGDSGTRGDGRGQGKRPKNAPERLGYSRPDARIVIPAGFGLVPKQGIEQFYEQLAITADDIAQLIAFAVTARARAP